MHSDAPSTFYRGDPHASPVRKQVVAVRAAMSCEPLPERHGELTATCGLMGMGPSMCRWPIGDPREPGFGFCGRPGERYCPTHTKQAYASHAARDWVDRRLSMPTRAQRAA